MPSQKNTQQLAELKEKIQTAKAIALADYRGLTVGQITELRTKIKEVGGELKVAKNTLLKLALDNAELNQTKALIGPTLILFANEDEATPLKILVDFAQEYELPTLKAGFLGEEFLDVAQLTALAKLPSRQQLQAKFVGQLSAPIHGLVNVLSGNLRNLIYVLQAIKQSRKN